MCPDLPESIRKAIERYERRRKRKRKRKPKRRGTESRRVVGFYKDEEKRTRPITAPTGRRKRKTKVVVSRVQIPEKLVYKGKVVGQRITEAELLSKVLGTTPTVTSRGAPKQVSPYYWEKYKHKYPGFTRQPFTYEYVWDPVHETVEAVKVPSGKHLFDVDPSAIPKELRHLKGDELAKAYAQYEAERRKIQGEGQIAAT